MSRRAQQALETRAAIVRAARLRFAAQGYGGTSVAEIAADAGVSIQTIYDSLGSKRAIVLALNDLIDSEGDVATLAARIPTAEDPVELLQIAIAITRNINERCADIIAATYDAAASEPEMRGVRDESRRRHRAGIAGLTGRLDRLAALRPGTDVAEAGDVIAAMTDPTIVRTFVEEYGWSWQRWADWTLDALVALVLDPSRPR